MYQNHAGEVTIDGSGNPTGSTRRVSYVYATSTAYQGGNYSRLADTMYPEGNGVSYDYGDDTSAIDHLISRASDIRPTFSLGPGITFATYSRIGLSMDALVDLPVPDVMLTRVHALNGETDPGEYPGFDRFGRVTQQMWVDGPFGPHPSLSTFPDRTPAVAIGYAYDKASNRIKADDIRPSAKRSDRHTDYLYDGLHRLKEAKRGVRNGSFTHSPLNRSQQWSLDALGNWNSFGQWDGTSYAHTERGHNSDNNELDYIKYICDTNLTFPQFAYQGLCESW